MPYEVNKSNNAAPTYAPPQRQRDYSIPLIHQPKPQTNHVNQASHQNYSPYMPPSSLRNHPSSTFVCVGCKTVNNKNPFGQSFCSTCKSPARF